MRRNVPLKATLGALGILAIVLAPGIAGADLTSELCGKVANLPGGTETVSSEGVRTNFHIDAAEGRTIPVPHCFIHGTLAGDTRFRILLPKAWNGKYVFGLGGGYGGSENANTEVVTLPVVSEGYAFASSNEGRPAPVFDQADTWQELHYIRNHQTTQFAKGKIQALYGRLPSRSYLFGSSGGGWRSLSQIERYPQTYDGAGIRNPVIEPRNFAYQYSLLDTFFPVISGKIAAIIQARDRKEDPFAFLTPGEAAALQRLYDGGATVGSEFKFTQTGAATISLGYPVFPAFDPAYFEDFWTMPGYAGHDGEVDDQVIEGVRGTVSAVGAPNADGEIFSFQDASKAFGPDAIKGWRVTVTTGALAGQAFHVVSHTPTQINVTGFGGPLNGLAVGDTYTLSNRDFLAWQHYHQHIAQCEFPEYAGECSGGRPLRVQRPQTVQQAFKTRGATFSGRIRRPVVSTAQDLDHLVYPPVIHRYFEAVRAVLGDKAKDMLRVYWNQNHSHGNPLPNELNRMVERGSSWHTAFQLMVRWVEQGVPPPPDTVVTITPGLLSFPASAAERKGLQPTVSATANGLERVVVPAGSTVLLDGIAASPIGQIAKYAWDFEGNSRYDCDSDDADATLPSCGAGPFAPAPEVRMPALHQYSTRGTFVATVRVHDNTDNPGPFDGIENLARVVIVVE